VALFPADHFTVISTGASHIHTTNTLTTGRRIAMPAIYALVAPQVERSHET
jgi:hypothetical protein